MILKKRFIKWLCLPIAISMASIPSSYALTGEQYKMLIYGAAAAGAWGAWGTLNSVLTYVTRGDHTITTADGANAIGTICGATAAATFRLWNPPTDPVSAANVVMAATKAGAIPGAATACRWVSNAFLQIYFTEAQNSGRRLSTTQRNRLSADATRVAMLRDQVGAKIDAAGPKIRAANNATLIYNYRCLNAIGVTRYCYDLEYEKLRLQQEADAATLAAKQAAWDLASAVLAVANDEHQAIDGEHFGQRPG